MSNSRHQSLFTYGMAQGRRQEFPMEQSRQNAPLKAKPAQKSRLQRLKEYFRKG